ncbi:hypothetical protein GOM71_18910 [Paenibacillus sp. NEAU-GSW1]|nr:hypothetical protein [Paenibacillus sp. NEAU-GSW1]
MPKKQRRTFTTKFKKQMVQLYENEKTRAAIVEEYNLTWISQAQTTGSFTRYQQCATSCKSQEVRFITTPKNESLKMMSLKLLWISFSRTEKPTVHARSK